MCTVELWKEVINSLANADERFLHMGRELYNSYAKEEMDSFEALPDEIIELISQSRESIKKVNIFSHKEVMEEVAYEK